MASSLKTLVFKEMNEFFVHIVRPIEPNVFAVKKGTDNRQYGYDCHIFKKIDYIFESLKLWKHPSRL